MTRWRIEHGDCSVIMAAMAEASVDAIVCDPPYSLGFMGRDWDRDVAHGEWASRALRVLKSGGHLLAFGGTRTFHRLACALEDAGFEIRDTLCWLYGSGFPKSLDVSKAIDKAAGAQRAIVSTRRGGAALKMNGENPRPWHERQAQRHGEWDVTAAATAAARQWQGWGTALKPAWEPIILARKPLTGTVAANVLRFGTGALNVDGCRIRYVSEDDKAAAAAAQRLNHDRPGEVYKGCGATGFTKPRESIAGFMANLDKGRWPANLVLSHSPECNGTCAPDCAVKMLDAQSGESVSPDTVVTQGVNTRRSSYAPAQTLRVGAGIGYGDSGGASRFFYCAKADTAERGNENAHPTVKPIALMRWLVRLITPPGGTVLDPFAGSGSTLIAALQEGVACIGIEQDADYVALARQRVIDDAPLFNRVTP